MTQNTSSTSRQLGDSFAVALLTWPAVIAVIEMGDTGWAFALKLICASWATLVSLGMIFGRKEGPRWGLTMTLCTACAAAFWMTTTSLWSFLWFVALMITFHAAIKARFDEDAISQATTNAD